MRKFFEAIFVLSGMIIGVGMFAIPFSFLQAGFWVGAAELAVLSVVVLAMHLLYGEMVLGTPRFHRMPGYIRLYLGSRAAAVSWASTLFGVIGTLLAYLAVGALFLSTIFSGAGWNPRPVVWAVLMAGAGGIITFFPLKKAARINGLLTVFEIGFIAALAAYLLPNISPAHLTGARPEYLFFPYGVILFALVGGSVIPDMITVLNRGRARTRAAIAVGSLIPATLYFFFALGVVGVSGPLTSQESLAGLQQALGGRIALWGSIAGLLAVFTSFVALEENFEAVLRIDMGAPKRMAWVVAAAVPLLFYFAGLQDFIAIIAAVGAIGFGVDSALIILAYRRMRRKRGRPLSLWFRLGAAVVFLMVSAGVAYELYRFFM